MTRLACNPKSLGYSAESVSPDRHVREVNNRPALALKECITEAVPYPAFGGAMLPAVAFQGDAECWKGKINRIAPDFMLEEIGNAKSLQCRLGQCLDVSSVSLTSLVAKIARLPTIAHSHEGCTTVRATASAFSLNAVSWQDLLVAAESAGDGCAGGSTSTRIGAVPSTAAARPVNNESLATLLAGFLDSCRKAALKRAVTVLGRLTHHHRKGLTAGRTLLFYAAPLAGIRAKAATLRRMRYVLSAARLADYKSWSGFVAILRAEARTFGLIWSAIKDLAAPLTGAFDQSALSILRALRSPHSMHYSTNVAHGEWE